MSSSLRIIRATAHTFWGWCHSTLKITFYLLIRSKVDYAAPAWQPWLSATNLFCLDRLQNRSLWLNTGQLVSTPLAALRLEADVSSYHTCSNRLILKAREKALRSTDYHLKHVALAADIPQRLQNCYSFCRKVTDFPTILPAKLEHRQSNNFPSPTWQLAPLEMNKFSLLFLISLVRLMILIWNAYAISHSLHHTRSIKPSAPTDPPV